MKLNKKGFMMAEVVVVSAIILIFLAALYVSYNQLYSKYKSRVKYFDPVSLYRLSYYRDVLVDNKKINSVMDDAKNSSKGVLLVYDSNDKLGSVLELGEGGGLDNRAFVIYNNKNNLNGDELDAFTGIHMTFKDYLKYLATSVDLNNSDFVMVYEQCETDDDCKYAYLELYYGYVINVEAPVENVSPEPTQTCTCVADWSYTQWSDYGGCWLNENSVGPDDDTTNCVECKPGVYKCRSREKWWNTCKWQRCS